MLTPSADCRYWQVTSSRVVSQCSRVSRHVYKIQSQISTFPKIHKQRILATRKPIDRPIATFCFWRWRLWPWSLQFCLRLPTPSPPRPTSARSHVPLRLWWQTPKVRLAIRLFPNDSVVESLGRICSHCHYSFSTSSLQSILTWKSVVKMLVESPLSSVPMSFPKRPRTL